MSEEMSFNELQEILSVCLDEITVLKQEKLAMQSQINTVTQSLLQIMNKYKELAEEYEETKANIAVSLKLLDKGIDNLPYEIQDPKRDLSSFFYPLFYDIQDTLKKIIDERCSMARFGDGELSIMAHHDRQKFQEYTPELAERLNEVINVRDDRFLIAIADNYGSLTNYSRAGKSGIRNYMSEQVRNEHKAILDLKRTYHNAYISRPYVLFSDVNTDGPGTRFMQLKKIWEKRKVIIVEGSLSRLGVGNNLFDGAASISRVLAPPENAFRKYKEILKASLECATDECLFLIALGPMAGVLAYDLYKAGYQAIDIGHVDLEYEWFLKGEGCRCEVKTKYNNEYTGGEIVEEISDNKYLSQIAITIK